MLQRADLGGRNSTWNWMMVSAYGSMVLDLSFALISSHACSYLALSVVVQVLDLNMALEIGFHSCVEASVILIETCFCSLNSTRTGWTCWSISPSYQGKNYEFVSACSYNSYRFQHLPQFRSLPALYQAWPAPCKTGLWNCQMLN